MIKLTAVSFHILIHSISFHLLHCPNQANETCTSSTPSSQLKWQLIGGVLKLLTGKGQERITLFCKVRVFLFFCCCFFFICSVYLLTWTTLEMNSLQGVVNLMSGCKSMLCPQQITAPITMPKWTRQGIKWRNVEDGTLEMNRKELRLLFYLPIQTET